MKTIILFLALATRALASQSDYTNSGKMILTPEAPMAKATRRLILPGRHLLQIAPSAYCESQAGSVWTRFRCVMRIDDPQGHTVWRTELFEPAPDPAPIPIPGSGVEWDRRYTIVWMCEAMEGLRENWTCNGKSTITTENW